MSKITPFKPARARFELSEELVEILDREHPDVPWKPPGEDWIKEHLDAIRDALARVLRALEPATEPFIRERLAALSICSGSRAGVEAEWKIRAAEYLRLLDGFPLDIWQGAIDEWLHTSNFFPSVKELGERMRERLNKRLAYKQRLEAMLNASAPAVEHRSAAVDVWRKAEVELRREIEDRPWKAWITMATPHLYDGETLTLVVPNKFIAQHIRAQFGPTIERVLGQRIRLVVTNWAGAAARERWEARRG